MLLAIIIVIGCIFKAMLAKPMKFTGIHYSDNKSSATLPQVKHDELCPMTPENACLRLSTFIQHHLPLIQAMELSIEHYDQAIFEVSAPLEKNHNDKLTAFGGSLYNLCITNAIGLCFLQCYENEILEPDLVVAKANIHYLKPVKTETIIARCEIPTGDDWQSFFTTYAEEGKAAISLTSRVIIDGETCVEFSARFAIIGENQTQHKV